MFGCGDGKERAGVRERPESELSTRSREVGGGRMEGTSVAAIEASWAAIAERTRARGGKYLSRWERDSMTVARVGRRGGSGGEGARGTVGVSSEGEDDLERGTCGTVGGTSAPTGAREGRREAQGSGNWSAWSTKRSQGGAGDGWEGRKILSLSKRRSSASIRLVTASRFAVELARKRYGTTRNVHSYRRLRGHHNGYEH